MRLRKHLNLDVGVSWDSEKKKWRVRRYMDDKVIRLPRFKTRRAARAANRELMNKYPRLTRYKVSPISGCHECVSNAAVHTLCKRHYQRARKRGYRACPHNNAVCVSLRKAA